MRKAVELAILLLAAGTIATPAFAQTSACVLHVTGAKPRPFKPSIFVKVKGPLPNPDDPSTSAYQYNPVTRALALTDAELQTLFPTGGEVQIVRHREGITKQDLTAAQGVLFPRTSACHTELIVSDIVGVFPSGSHPHGVIGSLLAGKARLDLVFTFRRFDAGEERALKIADRTSGRLQDSDIGTSAAELSDVLAAATSRAFSDFSRDVAGRARTR